jgi:hypothetical protein
LYVCEIWSHIEGGTTDEGIREQGDEEDIWASDRIYDRRIGQAASDWTS